MNKTQFKTIIVCIIIIALVIIGFVWKHHANVVASQAMKAPPTVVNFTKSQSKMWADQMRAVGTVTAKHEIKLSAQTSGRITKIYIKPGQKVKSGQLLYQLYSGLEESTLAQAIAQLKAYKDQYERANKLYKSQDIAAASLEEIKQKYEAQLAAVQKDKAALELTRITAPTGGTIGIINIKTGNFVNIGQVLNTLISSDAREVVFSLPVSQTKQVHVGDKVFYELDKKLVSKGQVISINVVADPNDHMQEIKASIDKSLTPGSYAVVVIEIGARKPIVVVPSSAIDQSVYGDSVFKVVNGHAVSTFVKTGVQRGEMIEVTGIPAGTTVINGGLNKVMPNAEVTNKGALN